MSIELPEAYALLPIYHYDKVLGKLIVKNIREVGYAVSKCYIIEEKTNYEDDGTVKKQYRVQFPYIDIYIENKDDFLIDNIVLDRPIEKIVDAVYEDYTSAKKVAIERNKLPYDKEIRKVKNRKLFKKKYDKKIDYVERNSVRKLLKERTYKL